MKIFCIGRNYAKHVAEQHTSVGSSDELPEELIWFMKPDTALLRNNDPFYIPRFTSECEYECELVVKINRVGRSISPKFAHRYFDEVGLGIDFTARDVQRRAIAAGLPWEQAKAWDHSAALSPEFVKLSDLGGDVQNLQFTLDINGERRQTGLTTEMLFPVEQIVARLSEFVTLKIGDLIYTGTPVGVGRVMAGDRLTAQLKGRTLLDFEIR